MLCCSVSPVWGCRETLEQSVLLLAATPGRSGFLGDIHLLPVTSRFTPPPDAPCHGKPRPLPPTSVHAPGPAPAAAAAHSDLLLRPWSDEFWESWLPLPPWSSAPSAPSSSLFQHAGKPGAPRLCPGQEQVGCCGVWVCSARCSWERMWSSWAAPWGKAAVIPERIVPVAAVQLSECNEQWVKSCPGGSGIEVFPYGTEIQPLQGPAEPRIPWEWL